MSNGSGTKVVINACYGGFSLSDEATRAYLTRKGKQWREQTDPRYPSFGPSFYLLDGSEEGEHFSSRDINRSDPDLLAVVEEMGDAADGRCARLEVEELAAGTLYVIDEYDGLESIQTRDGIGWSIA